MSGKLEIMTFVQGALENNCYVISDGANAFAIDPSYDGEILKKAIAGAGFELKGVMLTHFHLDHIDGILAFEGVRIYMSGKDYDILVSDGVIEYMSENFFGRDYMSQSQIAKIRDFFLKSEIIRVYDGFVMPDFARKIVVWETPGHSPGSVSYCCEDDNTVFTGDTLFFHSYGRIDLPFSNGRQMMKSLDRLSCLPVGMKVYPGHGAESTIEEEREYGFLKRMKYED